MTTKSWHISRRTVLKGMGAAIALPFLEAMMPGLAVAAPASKRHSFTASQLLTSASIASSGVGVALVPSSATDLFSKLRLELRPLVHPKLVRHLGIIRLVTRPKTTVADEFSNFIVDAFKE